jgi:hypothetical protein
VRKENLSGDAVRSVVDQDDTPCPGVPESVDDQQSLRSAAVVSREATMDAARSRPFRRP